MVDLSSARLKDEQLAEVSRVANVAQFVSYGPGPEAPLRHRVLRHDDPSVAPIEALFRRSAARTVNVRSFLQARPSGNPFQYAMTDPGAVESLVRSLAQDGYHAIVNETLEVEDGGVSGVRWNGWTEFAPEDTPRCVEHPGTAGLPSAVAEDVFEVIYGVGTPLQDLRPTFRVEFSLHPRPVGCRGERSIVWEVADVVDGMPEGDAHISWPNRFSRFIGDKAFGLLLADVLGLPVPRAQVLCRNVEPFTLGRPTGSARTWVRTCPRQFSPGRFPTYPNWVDVFALLADEDPSGKDLGAVLVQDGVDAAYSGSVVLDGNLPEVRGVAGAGDDYMTGSVPDSRLPRHIVDDAVALYTQAADLVGPCRIEWVHDGAGIWLVQLNRDRSDGFSLTNGTADRWVLFDPRDGVDGLVDLIDRIGAASTGVELTRRVGLTSHIGDILRSARVPVRLRGDRSAAAGGEQGRQATLW